LHGHDHRQRKERLHQRWVGDIQNWSHNAKTCFGVTVTSSPPVCITSLTLTHLPN
jgi:hypothetical protein